MTHTVTVQTIIKKDLATVWDFWTSPDHIMKWNSASPDWHTPRAENDVRTGGKFLSRMEAKDGSTGFDFGGTYTEIVPMQKIAYTISDGRNVSVEFIEIEDSVKITEAFEMENENSEELQRAGWQAILDNFKEYVETYGHEKV
jgi:uncharacterized protein YndB with AHSA1/START domain